MSDSLVCPSENPIAKWPKILPVLTDEQRAISDDFMRHWHEVLPRRFGLIEKFNHGYVVRYAPRDFMRTLEVGAGLGEHLRYEQLTPEQTANYYAVDIRPNMVEKLRAMWPQARAFAGDFQQRLDFPDGFFDRIVAVHVLEHLPDLPSALREAHRLCNKDRGVFQIVIPCEGGLAYGMARRISAQRIFEQRYKQPYSWFIKREHVNVPSEIVEEIRPLFSIRHRTYFPLPGLGEWCNLCIGMTLTPLASRK